MVENYPIQGAGRNAGPFRMLGDGPISGAAPPLDLPLGDPGLVLMLTFFFFFLIFIYLAVLGLS